MTIYKRGGSYWADFTIAGRRYRIPLKASNKQEAANLEKLRIGEAQTHGGLLPAKSAKLTVAEAGDVYFQRRDGDVSASTIRLEKDAFKQVKRHLCSSRLSAINLESLAEYIGKRKKEKIGNRTINIEIGVLRRVMKQFKLWHVVSQDYKPLPENKGIGRALTPEQELNLFSVASSRPEWSVAFWVSLIAANTTAGGCELRNLRLEDIHTEAKMLCVRVGKNRFRVRTIPLNRTAWWAVERLLDRAHKLGSTKPEHYLIPQRLRGKQYDPAKPPSRWAWRTAWRKLTDEAGLAGLRPTTSGTMPSLVWRNRRKLVNKPSWQSLDT